MGQDGTMSGDTPWSRRQPGPGRHQRPHSGVLGAGVPAVAWGASAEFFFLLISSPFSFYLPPIRVPAAPPSLALGAGRVEQDLYLQQVFTPSPCLLGCSPVPWAQSRRAPWGHLLCSRTALSSNTPAASLGLAPLS